MEAKCINRKELNKSVLKRKENLIGWLYCCPMIFGIVVFTAIPLVMSVMSMFYDWNGIISLTDSEFVGWKNFISVFGGLNSEKYWNSLKNTFIFAIQVPVCIVIGLFLGMAMNRKMHGVQTFRIIYYLPAVMSVVAIAIVFQKLFEYDGFINTFLVNLGLDKVDWLISDGGVAFTVNFLLVWKGVGYTALMYIAGLQSVSTDQLEAAKMDGANSWTIFIKITLPALYPIIFYLFVTGLMSGLQMFNEPYILLNGYGTGDNGMTAVSFVYYFFGQRSLGVAAVGAWFLALLIFIITAIQMAVDKRVDKEA